MNEALVNKIAKVLRESYAGTPAVEDTEVKQTLEGLMVDIAEELKTVVDECDFLRMCGHPKYQ